MGSPWVRPGYTMGTLWVLWGVCSYKTLSSDTSWYDCVGLHADRGQFWSVLGKCPGFLWHIKSRVTQLPSP